MFEFRKMKAIARAQVWQSRKACAIVGAVFALFALACAVSLRGGGFFSGSLGRDDGEFFAFLFLDLRDFLAALEGAALSAIRIAVFGALFMAAAKFFLSLSRSAAGERLSFSRFLDGLCEWRRGIFALVWALFWISMWALLFIIPGIVKAFEYSQIFFILADCPKMSVPKALKISRAMTRGFKGDIFFAFLSFAPWILICAATGGIFLLWTLPYFCASFARLYGFLKGRALAEGRLLPADFE